jgi:hypothetical protein
VLSDRGLGAVATYVPSFSSFASPPHSFSLSIRNPQVVAALEISAFLPMSAWKVEVPKIILTHAAEIPSRRAILMR